MDLKGSLYTTQFVDRWEMAPLQTTISNGDHHSATATTENDEQPDRHVEAQAADALLHDESNYSFLFCFTFFIDLNFAQFLHSEYIHATVLQRQIDISNRRNWIPWKK